MSANQEELRNEIIKVSDLLYQNNLGEGVKAIPALIRKLSTLGSMLPGDMIPPYTNILKNIMEAMEIKDYVLLADLLVYEVQPFLDSCQ